MRVFVDPTQTRPAHALTKAQLRDVLSALPPEWVAPVKVVRLCNDLSPQPAANFSLVTNRLNIHSRGKAITDVIRDIITELLLHHSMTHPTPLWRLTASQRRNLAPKIDPLLSRVLDGIRAA